MVPFLLDFSFCSKMMNFMGGCANKIYSSERDKNFPKYSMPGAKPNNSLAVELPQEMMMLSASVPPKHLFFTMDISYNNYYNTFLNPMLPMPITYYLSFHGLDQGHLGGNFTFSL